MVGLDSSTHTFLANLCKLSIRYSGLMLGLGTAGAFLAIWAWAGGLSFPPFLFNDFRESPRRGNDSVVMRTVGAIVLHCMYECQSEHCATAALVAALDSNIVLCACCCKSTRFKLVRVSANTAITQPANVTRTQLDTKSVFLQESSKWHHLIIFPYYQEKDNFQVSSLPAICSYLWETFHLTLQPAHILLSGTFS